MSDGPWKTLKMSRAWRKVARFAANDASSSGEVAENVRQALIDDVREIPLKLISALRKAFGDGRQGLLALNEPDKLLALRALADGSPLGASLISHAMIAANKSGHGDDALQEAVIWALLDWTTRSARHVEEHHYREAGDGLASKIRGVIQRAGMRINLAALAKQILGVDASLGRSMPRKFTGIDEGPPL